MPGLFEKIHHEQSVLKLKILSVCAFISAFAFFYFMVNIDPSHKDWLPGRFILAVISLVAFIASLRTSTTFTRIRYYVNMLIWGYILMYFYLLILNDWSVFHRWSYFVVIAIMATVGLTWRDYIYTAVLALLLPVIFGPFGSLTPLAQVHFHAANFVTFIVVGITIKSNFEYRDKVIKLTDNLIQNSKMAALGQMSSGISHEINTPLAIITNSSEQIELFTADTEKNKTAIHASLEKINKAVSRISRIVQGLHNFSQGDSSEVFSRVDAREIITDACELYSEKFRTGGVELTCSLPEQPVMAFCQRVQLIQLLSNLLLNAYDDCSKHPQPKINVTLTTDNSDIKISVSDSGPGVPKAIENQIMQPFFTTKDIGQGTGLGLSIALGIARSNNGELYLDRAVSPSCFTLKIPLA